MTWKMDSERVTLCPRCWPRDPDAGWWLSVESDPDDEYHCETCGWYESESWPHALWRRLMNRTWRQRWFVRQLVRRLVG